MSGPQCCANPPVLSATSGTGLVGNVGGFSTYISASPDSKLGVILASDVYGYEAPNLRKLADKIAAAGFYVVVPDLLCGDPYKPDNAAKPIQEWFKSHGADKGTEDTKAVVADLKSRNISAIGVVGFCWGAKVVVELAKSSDIKAAVLLHPSLVSIDDIKEVSVPIAILGAEIDKMSPPELLNKFLEVLSAKPEVDCFVKIFPGVAHGWSVRYSNDDELAVKSAEEAHQDLIDWCTKYVK